MCSVVCDCGVWCVCVVCVRGVCGVSMRIKCVAVSHKLETSHALCVAAKVSSAPGDIKMVCESECLCMCVCVFVHC